MRVKRIWWLWKEYFGCSDTCRLHKRIPVFGIPNKGVIPIITPWNKIYCTQGSFPIADYIRNDAAVPTLSPVAMPHSRAPLAFKEIIWEDAAPIAEPLHQPARPIPPPAPLVASCAPKSVPVKAPEPHIPLPSVPVAIPALVTAPAPEPMSTEGDKVEKPVRKSTAAASFTRSRIRQARRLKTAKPKTERESDADFEPDPDAATRADPQARGLLYYKKWWFHRRVDISVNETLLTGTPIFIRESTLRVVNDDCSYIIPMRNVDYIRTPDGLRAAHAHFERCAR